MCGVLICCYRCCRLLPEAAHQLHTRLRLRYVIHAPFTILLASAPISDFDLHFCISRISRAAARAHMISLTLRPLRNSDLSLLPCPLPTLTLTLTLTLTFVLTLSLSLSCACVVNVPIIRHPSRIRLPHARGAAPRPAGARVSVNAGVGCVHTAPPSRMDARKVFGLSTGVARCRALRYDAVRWSVPVR